MSGYLNALLRASGLAGAKRSAPQRLESEQLVGVPYQGQDLGETSLVPVRAEGRAVATPAREGLVAPPERHAEPERPREDSPSPASIESRPGVTQSKVIAPPHAAETQKASVTEPAAAVTSATKTAAVMPVQSTLQGIDAVRAAIRWVAADPGVGKARAVTDPVARAGVEGRIVEVPVATAPNPHAAQSRVDSVAPVAPRPRLPAPALAITPPEPELTRERPRRAAVPAATPDTNRVEVSIGAIHVKVDPPPSPTAVRAAAPPARGPAPSRLTSRSSIARRALRRL
jgi:hypothetical protein